jgi:predicted O-linked N-acetylglucosamine transferase (SPINDLY family)
LRRFDEAVASYNQAISLAPDDASAFYNRGAALHELKRFEEAVVSYDRAIELKLSYPGIFFNRGNALYLLRRFDEALASYDHAIALKSDYAEAFNNRANALKEVKRLDEALANCERAIAIKPDYADAHYNHGNALEGLNRLDAAVASYTQAIALAPDHKLAFSGLADCALKLCDWRLGEDELGVQTTERKLAMAPFTLLAYSSDPSLHLNCARRWIADKIQVLPRTLWTGAIYRKETIRIAYLSADFRQHATAYLMAELFALHDRARFEVLGISFGTEDNSDIRARLIESFDQFHDVRLKTDYEVAQLLTELQVELAVDLKGYTRDARPGILAHRPAPIQVNYLGYPGTMGASFIDYVIADPIVLPFEQQPFYTEKIIQLPDCYQVNDSRRRIGDRTPTRQETGLPDAGFVFCCFNNNYKITAPVFDVWVRLLRAVNGSVLWLLVGNATAQNNLRQEAVARGIDPARLVFAAQLSPEEHLARHRLADLFLDTLPYNAHTTASDALWAGLPLVTCRGETFAGRVAASLLHAIGLPELVTGSLDEYEALALQLAMDASRLQSIRRKLAQNRLGYPLFDTDRFRRHIEAAYLTAWEIWQRGESPRSFKVQAAP